jgi:alginate O-acetyltransferase complex protein AlgI
MAFNSLEFIYFYIIVLVVYFASQNKYRWIILLSASYIFYMSWNLKYALLLIFTTAVTYCSGILLGQIKYARYKKGILTLSIFGNILMLFIFKYFNFINGILYDISRYMHISYEIQNLNLLLPIGISFYTFQSVGYLIDVYRGTKTPERHFGILALFLSFFPIVLAGPIERSTNLLPQLKKKYDFSYERAVSGTRLVCWGFFKKLVIADRFGIVVDHIYSSPENYLGIPLILASLFFIYQLYCDFSGYSDIAIGTARIMGFDLVINFNRPFASKSTAEIWRRWHISLFSWFKNYLYIPIGGNRVGPLRWIYNILFVFTISGLWHGAAWTYVIWGGLQGVFIVASKLTSNVRKRIYTYLNLYKCKKIHSTFQVLITFALFTFSFIIFRASNLNDAIYIITHLHIGLLDFILHVSDTGYLRSIFGLLGVQQEEIVIAAVSVAVLEVVQFIQRDDKPIFHFGSQPAVLRWLEYYLMVGSILFYGSFNSTQGFIYYQF